jgi:hypothetical protein
MSQSSRIPRTIYHSDSHTCEYARQRGQPDCVRIRITLKAHYAETPRVRKCLICLCTMLRFVMAAAISSILSQPFVLITSMLVAVCSMYYTCSCCPSAAILLVSSSSSSIAASISPCSSAIVSAYSIRIVFVLCYSSAAAV